MSINSALLEVGVTTASQVSNGGTVFLVGIFLILFLHNELINTSPIFFLLSSVFKSTKVRPLRAHTHQEQITAPF